MPAKSAENMRTKRAKLDVKKNKKKGMTGNKALTQTPP